MRVFPTPAYQPGYSGPRNDFRETIAGRISEIEGDVRLNLGISDEEIRGLERVTIIACGTSYHA